jgi:hypothetical protein
VREKIDTDQYIKNYFTLRQHVVSKEMSETFFENQDIYRTLTYLKADPDFRLADGVVYYELHGDAGFIFRALTDAGMSKYVRDDLVESGYDVQDFTVGSSVDWDGHKTSRVKQVTVASTIHSSSTWLKTDSAITVGCFMQRRGKLTNSDPHKLYRLIDYNPDTKLLYLCTGKDVYGFYIANAFEFNWKYPAAVLESGFIKADFEHPELLITPDDGSFVRY